MILDKVGDPASFRAAVHAWFAEAVVRHAALGYDAMGQDLAKSQHWWMSERDKVGLAIPHWPRSYGGADLDLAYQMIIVEEAARLGAPPLNMFMVSLNHVPSTLLAFGTETQKNAFLPQVPKGQVWCQGFSEPGAGSDLAALRTRAVRRGDRYVVNGQKIWSSYSMYADQCILLARTDPTSERHAGISFFLMDMQSPGIEVRPIVQANGRAKFAEIFLTDVEIPVENLVGEEGQGWKISQTTLSAERGVLSFEQAETLRQVMERFHAGATRRSDGWLRDDELRRRFMQLFGRMQALQRMIRTLILDPHAHGGQLALHVKIASSTLKRDFGDFVARTSLDDAILHDGSSDELGGPGMFVYLSAFGSMIGGGTNEIMRNVIAERGFGMPR